MFYYIDLNPKIVQFANKYLFKIKQVNKSKEFNTSKTISGSKGTKYKQVYCKDETIF